MDMVLHSHEHDGDATCALSSHDKSLFDISRFRWSRDERTETVIVKFYLFVRLVHIVYNACLVQKDYQIFANEISGFLFCRLGYPHTGILLDTQFALDDGDVCA